MPWKIKGGERRKLRTRHGPMGKEVAIKSRRRIQRWIRIMYHHVWISLVGVPCSSGGELC
jgi:hypothetical protein